jgi:pimeloyl-ACP methyl ester carboxylesterase
MKQDRIHRAVSVDGTAIAGRVRGQGPPLVLIPAGPGDAETTWRPVLPHLIERFTCYLADTRGRGLSADHPDHSPERLMEDITSFVESVGEPVGVVEWGSFVGAGWSLIAATRAPAIFAVATYDPLLLELAPEEDAARLHDVLGQVGELAAEGRLAEGARSFVAGLAEHGYYTAEDMVDGATSAFWSASAANIPMFFRELEQADEEDGPEPTEPAELATITVPVLLMHGARSHPMNIDFVRHMARYLPERQVRAIAGAGHYGPHTHPEAVSRELGRFFQEVRQPA